MGEDVKRKNAAAVALGRRGGKVKSEAKAAAVRLNGRRRLPKYSPGAMVTIKPGAPRPLVGQAGTIAAYLGRTRYRVTVDGHDHELRSWWLAPASL